MATYYWVGGSGTWDNSSKTNWATSTGGTGGNGPPVTGDTVNFDANSGTAAIVTVAATAACTTCTINKSDINLSLSGSPTFAGTTTLTAGTVTLNSYTLTVNIFSSSNSNARTIDFGTGKISLTGNGSAIWVLTTVTNLTVSGTPVVDCIYAGATGTRTIQNGSTAGGAESNAVSFNITAGTDTITLTSSATNAVKNLNFSGFAGTMTSTNFAIYGNLVFSSGMTLLGGTHTTTFAATTGTQTITSNGKAYDRNVTISGGSVVELVDPCSFGTARTLTLTSGTFDAKNQNVSIGNFALGAGTKTLTLGSGTWTVTGTSWNANTNVTGLTVTASTGKISMTSASSKTFAGGGASWPTLDQAGAGALTIQQSNTFANIINSVQPATITFTAGTTQTVSAFGVSGTAGNLITLNSSSSGSRATLSDASGTINVSYVSIKDIAATGGAGWDAYTSNGNVDAGNNTGWVFDPAPSDVSVEFFMNLRSFTEPRRF